MNSNDYLQRLQVQLKGFSAEEQVQLIEEIAAHIESGENDPGFGQDAASRARKLENELGSPEDLGKRLRNVHRPNRLLDFLLVFVPTGFIFPLLPFLLSWIFETMGTQSVIGAGSTYMWVQIRIWILMYAFLLALCLWKGSPATLLYWLPTTILGISVLLLREGRLPFIPDMVNPAWNSNMLLETCFWLLAALFLLVFLVRLLQKYRTDSLLWVLAVLPFLIAAANLTSGLTLRYYHIEQLETVSFTIGWFGLHQIVGYVWPALFYLPSQRILRWAGLFVFTLPYLVYYAWPSRIFPLSLILYILPSVLVGAAWVRDIRGKSILAPKYR